jgi:hypothetical protein
MATGTTRSIRVQKLLNDQVISDQIHSMATTEETFAATPSAASDQQGGAPHPYRRGMNRGIAFSRNGRPRSSSGVAVASSSRRASPISRSRRLGSFSRHRRSRQPSGSGSRHGSFDPVGLTRDDRGHHVGRCVAVERCVPVRAHSRPAGGACRDGSRGPAGHPADDVGQRHALDEFHHQRANAVRLLEPVHVRDIGMIEPGEDLRFALAPGEPIGIVREKVRQDLDRDVTIQPGIERGTPRPCHPCRSAW